MAADEPAPEVDPDRAQSVPAVSLHASPLTIFKGIRKLAPGTMLVVEEGECREERWYNFAPIPFSPRKKDDEATEELLELYRAAVKTASPERCSGRDPSQRRSRFRIAPRADE